MIPSLGRFIEGFNHFARAHRVVVLTTAGELAEVLAEVAQLAAGEEAREPAAFFYAIVRRPEMMGALTGRYAARLVRNQAVSLALELHATTEELDELRLSIDLDELPFEDLRDWFEARLLLPR